jgi:serine/threonine-protein kinase CTR1
VPKRQNSWDSEHELMSPDHLPEHQQTPNGSSHNSMQKNELQSGSDAKSVGGVSPPLIAAVHGSGPYTMGQELRTEVSMTPRESAVALASQEVFTERNRWTGAVGAMNFQQAEEDYQLQLAIALRVAAEAAAVDDPGLSAASRGLHGNTRKMPGVNTVEATAYRFWVSNCLGYDDRIEDGFYEVWGMSPYVWSMCTDNNELGRIPPLAALQSVNTSESFEVVLVDRNDDPDLRDLEDKAVGLAYDCQEVLDLATRLAQMVADFMGGAAASDDELLEAWHANTTKMTQRIGSIVLPIGVLRPGLGRHRALLFKVMADSVGLPCRLVRGRSFSGKEEGALVVVKVGDDREWMVDLLESPGKIMAPDARLASPPAVIASPLQFERPSSFAISSILNWRDELGLRDPANSGGEVAPGPASELAASSRSAVPVAAAAATEAGKVGYGHSPRGATQQQQANDASPRGGGAGSGIPTGNRYNEDYHPRPSGFNKENVKGRASGDVSVAGRSDNSGGTNDRGRSSSPEEDSSRYSREKLVEHAVAFAKEYEIPWEDLLIGERIGQGSYGKVYRADWQGSDVAVKVFLDQHVQMEAIEEFKAEVAIMRRLRHPNVVLFMGAVTKPPNLSIITEFCPR